MKKVFILMLSLVALTACQPSAKKLSGEITSMENRLFTASAQGLTKESVDSLINKYEQFVKAYPKDTLAPVYLFKAAGVAMNTGNGEKAITLFEKVIKDYPTHPKASLAFFFKGYVEENYMKNLDQAKETYLLFLEKYPNSDFADDARASIENLGKSPEQMVKEFEAKQKADSLAATRKK
ncbi:MAG TPA: tetratricopeptide repeat protein [Bacteroidales bacterium]|nr:tetratricopeptide repeat protein [Bacteroidales bacterium]HPS73605.1 tetratricopeptide repeat protein [Bacteroidales bacterium]